MQLVDDPNADEMHATLAPEVGDRARRRQRERHHCRPDVNAGEQIPSRLLALLRRPSGRGGPRQYGNGADENDDEQDPDP
jgi:hypothetical protein